MNRTVNARIPLSFVGMGTCVRIADLDDAIAAVQRQQLAAYGVSPERVVTVRQQRPMTVIVADEVELALEASVARHIWVESPTPALP